MILHNHTSAKEETPLLANCMIYIKALHILSHDFCEMRLRAEEKVLQFICNLDRVFFHINPKHVNFKEVFLLFRKGHTKYSQLCLPSCTSELSLMFVYECLGNTVLSLLYWKSSVFNFMIILKRFPLILDFIWILFAAKFKTHQWTYETLVGIRKCLRDPQMSKA